MYLPSHELKMLNSRLYCAYCTMDVQDEIERQKKMAEQQNAPEIHKEEVRAAESHFGSSSSAAAGAVAVSSQSEPLSQHSVLESGICERCGVNAQQLYQFKGRKLCTSCVKEEGGSMEPAKSFFHKMHEVVAKFLLFKKKDQPEPSKNQPEISKNQSELPKK